MLTSSHPGNSRRSIPSRRTSNASGGWWRRRYRPAGWIVGRGLRTTSARSRRSAPAHPDNRAAAAVGGCALFGPCAEPRARRRYLLPQCFDPKIQAMQLGQLLGRQGGAKINVALAHEGQHGLAEHRTQSAVASAYHASAKSHRPDHQHGRSAAVGRSVFVRRRSAPWRLRQIGARQRHRSAPEGA